MRPASRVALGCGAFIIGTDAFLIAPLLPEIARDLDVSPVTAAWLVSSFTLTYAVAVLLGGYFLPPSADSRTLRRGIVVFVLGTLLTLATSWFWLALLGRVVTALGAVAYTPRAAAAAASGVPPEQRGKALAVVTVGLSLATAIGMPLGTVLGAVNWRFALAAVAVAAVALLPWLRGVDEEAPMARPSLSVLRLPGVVPALVVMVCAMAGQYVVYTFVTVVFGEAAGPDGARLPLLMAAFGVGAVVGGSQSGRLTDLLGSRTVAAGAIGVMSACLVWMVWASDTLGSGMAVMALWGVFGWMFNVPTQALLLGSVDRSAWPLVLSASSSALYLGATLGGVIGAAVLGPVGPSGLPLVGAALAVVAVGVAVLGSRKRSEVTV